MTGSQNPDVTRSQLRATATLHDRIRAAQKRFGAEKDTRRHVEAAKKLRARAARMAD